MDPLDYLGKKYDSCWHFAADFYGFPIDVPLDGFTPVDVPADNDYFLAFRGQRVYHCGVYHRGGYLHQVTPNQGVVYTQKGFTHVRYYRLTSPLRNGPDQ